MVELYPILSTMDKDFSIDVDIAPYEDVPGKKRVTFFSWMKGKPYEVSGLFDETESDADCVWSLIKTGALKAIVRHYRIVTA